jgi:hypothetical protein
MNRTSNAWPAPDPRTKAPDKWLPRTPWWVWVIGGGAIAAIITALAVSGTFTDDDDDAPSRQLTLIEAACRVLNVEDDRDDAYRVIRRMAADNPMTFEDPDEAARLAIWAAEADGCG